MADDLRQPPRDLYETDYLAWSEQQAALLRARGANALDYDNLAEEVEDLGKAEFHGCESRVERIIEHLLKLEFVGSERDQPHWRGEIVEFRSQLDRRLTRTIENRLVPGLNDLFLGQLKALVARELIADREVVTAARPNGYAWNEIRDSEWLPAPYIADH